MEKRQSPSKKGKQSQKDLVLNLLWANFHDHPEVIREHLPEIAALLEGSRSTLFRDYLTDRERRVRLDSFAPILEKYEKEGTLPKEEAIKALEDAAALKEHISNKEALVRMTLDVFGLVRVPEKKIIISIQKGLRKGQSYRLAKGIELILSWDGKLLAIEVDGKELARRQKALDFVGIASDPRGDVAEHHDTYAWEAFE